MFCLNCTYKKHVKFWDKDLDRCELKTKELPEKYEETDKYLMI